MRKFILFLLLVCLEAICGAPDSVQYWPEQQRHYMGHYTFYSTHDDNGKDTIANPACAGLYKLDDNSPVAAVRFAFYGAGQASLCGRCIAISVLPALRYVRVLDDCSTCESPYHIDLARGMFLTMQTEDAGIFEAPFSFVDCPANMALGDWTQYRE